MVSVNFLKLYENISLKCILMFYLSHGGIFVNFYQILKGIQCPQNDWSPEAIPRGHHSHYIVIDHIEVSLCWSSVGENQPIPLEDLTLPSSWRGRAGGTGNHFVSKAEETPPCLSLLADNHMEQTQGKGGLSISSYPEKNIQVRDLGRPSTRLQK